MHFQLEYNGDQIVVANVTEKMKEVQLPELADDSEEFEVTFSYSASWKENTEVGAHARARAHAHTHTHTHTHTHIHTHTHTHTQGAAMRSDTQASGRVSGRTNGGFTHACVRALCVRVRRRSD
jgi:hypothetical protein